MTLAKLKNIEPVLSNLIIDLVQYIDNSAQTGYDPDTQELFINSKNDVVAVELLRYFLLINRISSLEFRRGE